MAVTREGSLEMPTRHKLDWQNPSFYDEDKLYAEMERVFDICHGCRRCVSLCHSFPTLFDLIDESDTMEVDGVDKHDYWKIVEQCYLCDLCFLTKCPYVPPHEWNLDFPHLMLQAKAIKFEKEGASTRDKILTNTDMVGSFAGIPIVAGVVNRLNKNKLVRGVLHNRLGIHKAAELPVYHGQSLRARIEPDDGRDAEPVGRTTGKVVLFTTCYSNHNDPQSGEDLVAVFRHNGIAVNLVDKEQCCGMPKLELGDLKAVAKAKKVNIPALLQLVDEGWDIVAPVPSCVLMFKQELPLMFPDDPDVASVRDAMFDPFEYLMLRHKGGKLKTDFKKVFGKVAYHAACHQRVQRIGPKTREALELIPGIKVTTVERCSGHDGTYGVKTETHELSMKLVRPVANRIKISGAEVFASDCAMAGKHIAHGLRDAGEALHPITILRQAYGI